MPVTSALAKSPVRSAVVTYCSAQVENTVGRLLHKVIASNGEILAGYVAWRQSDQRQISLIIRHRPPSVHH